MAEVTGPISSMPGHRHDFPDGTMCDVHPDRPAVARIQGETDSFGCEMADCCAECLAEMRAELAAPNIGDCAWCSATSVERVQTRDYEEGMCGPIYHVCYACKERQTAQIEQDLRAYDDHYYDD